MQITINYQDIHLKRAIGLLTSDLSNANLLLNTIGASLLRVNNERHLKSLAPDGTPWAPLKSDARNTKRKGGPLIKSGDMINSLNYQVSQNTLLLGFDGERNARLAFWHHHGTDPYVIKPKNKKALKFGDRIVKKVNHTGLPSRPLLDFPDSDKKLIEGVITDHLSAVLNRV